MRRIILALTFLASIAQAYGWHSFNGPIISPPVEFPKQLRNDITFLAPLTDSLIPRVARGSYVYTYTRNSIATYLNPTTNLITLVGANVPRFEQNGYLSEGARTNSLVFSNSINGAGWVNANCTVTQFADTSPDGTVNASLVGAVAASASLYQPLSLAGAAYTSSIYIKRFSGTGTIYLTANAGTATGWTVKTITSAYTRISDTDTTGNPSFGIKFETAGDEIYIYGGQLEAGAFASSYIPTTTVEVARVADVLTYSAIANADTSKPGTMMVSGFIKDGGPGGASAPYFLDIGTSAATDRFSVLENTTRTTGLYFLVASAVQANLTSGASTVFPKVITGTWATNSFNGFINGSLYASDTAGVLPATPFTTLSVGKRTDASYSFANQAHVKAFSIPLTAWELGLSE